MRCLFPLTYDPLAKKLNARGGIKVPCGKCFYCLQDRAHVWALRSSHQLRTSACGFFVTLTYSDDNLPSGSLLNYSDVQLFHKRLRKVSPKFKFFLCGEYGPKTARPHYHACYFLDGYPTDFARSVAECWPLGFSTTRQISEDDHAANYVASYTSKKFFTEDVFGYAVLPFLRLSQGVGREFALIHAKSILSRGFVYSGKYKMSIPRYYLKVYEKELPDLFAAYLVDRPKVDWTSEKLDSELLISDKRQELEVSIHKSKKVHYDYVRNKTL
ncbi:replication initiator protein [robinz microvirus RP_188]|nr:replication initiator protein [robinz microvirus RP_84]UDN67908.1 replication initiator protein [robinz microvirus RP_188]